MLGRAVASFRALTEEPLDFMEKEIKVQDSSAERWRVLVAEQPMSVKCDHGDDSHLQISDMS